MLCGVGQACLTLTKYAPNLKHYTALQVYVTNSTTAATLALTTMIIIKYVHLLEQSFSP